MSIQAKEANCLAGIKIPLSLGFSATPKIRGQLNTSNRFFRGKCWKQPHTCLKSITLQGNIIDFQICNALHHGPSRPSFKKKNQNEKLNNEEINDPQGLIRPTVSTLHQNAAVGLTSVWYGQFCRLRVRTS